MGGSCGTKGLAYEALIPVALWRVCVLAFGIASANRKYQHWVKEKRREPHFARQLDC